MTIVLPEFVYLQKDSVWLYQMIDAVQINYQKWVGPLNRTADPSQVELQVWCSSVACFWSYSLPKAVSNLYQ